MEHAADDHRLALVRALLAKAEASDYPEEAEAFTANLRFAWLNTAGTGLFIVLNDGEAADSFTRWREPLARSLTVKYTRQIGSGG